MDILELKRVVQIADLQRFCEFFLSDHELQQLAVYPDAQQFAASRFALKEAVIKAVPQPLSFRDFEIIKEGDRPVVHFLISLEGYDLRVSLSHSSDYVAGFAVCYTNSYERP